MDRRTVLPWVLPGLCACGPATSVGDGASENGPGTGDLNPATTVGVSDSMVSTGGSGQDGDGDGDGADDGPCANGCFDVDTTPECTASDDCVLFDTCCYCLAHAIGEPDPQPCPRSCAQTMCAALGVTEAACGAEPGNQHCMPSRNCNAGTATCGELPPTCEIGWLPTVVDGCWSTCMPAQSCDDVGTCRACPAGDVCLPIELEPEVICATPLPDCDAGPPSCACVPDACPGVGYACSDEPRGPVCLIPPGPPG